MLFNSDIFIFVFLPTVLVGFFVLRKVSFGMSKLWLVGASLWYYGYWNPVYLWLLGFSLLANFMLGWRLEPGRARRRSLLALGIGLNLGLLGYFKYANFFVETIDAVTGASWTIGQIILPLAISFFTFQQIAYLVDAYKGETSEHSFLDYALFVTFFPQLIAGPIVHHKEMLPQFGSGERQHRIAENLSVGLTIFAIGLAKKVMIADAFAEFATPIFDSVQAGSSASVEVAWVAALAYTFQIYFDFSGYSDMAIGLGRMFGIVLPINFNSPYKATSIIDFWRRWHITLSRFLRDYLYIPLGGNRKGPRRRYVNILVTMLLGGLWHGAAWTFVFWGGLHGLYIVVNHGWRALRSRGLVPFDDRPLSLGWVPATAVTFLATVVAWVFFRAESFAAAWRLLQGMAGVGAAGYLRFTWLYVLVGVVAITAAAVVWDRLPRSVRLGEVRPVGAAAVTVLAIAGVVFGGTQAVGTLAEARIWIIGALLVCLFAPNTQEMLGDHEPGLGYRSMATRDGISSWLLELGRWRPAPVAAMAAFAAFILSIFNLGGVTEFIYYQF